MAYERFVVAGGESLRRFAIFTAIERTLGVDASKFRARARLAPRAGRRGLRARARRRNRTREIPAVSRRPAIRGGGAAPPMTAGLSLGFYRDLAVGCAPDGAEAFSEANRLMSGVSIGAPPDPLGPQGQIWGLPPFDPRALARDGFSGFGRLIAANMAYAGHPAHRPCAGVKAPVPRAGGRERRGGRLSRLPFRSAARAGEA